MAASEAHPFDTPALPLYLAPMALLTIYEVPHPILRQVAAEVPVVDDRIRTLIDDMAESMYAAPGVGLAAPQVGRSVRVIVAAVPVRDGVAEPQPGDEEAGHKAFLLALVNPRIVAHEGTILWDEGCLSVPDLNVDVKRHKVITVEALGRDGAPVRFVARDYYAVILQHEMDHLDGKTLYDRLSGLKKDLYLRKLKKARGDGPPTRDLAAEAEAS